MPMSVGTVRDIPVRALKLCGLTWSGEFLWFSEAVSNQIMALDPVSGAVERRVACPGVRTDLTTVAGNLVQVVGAERALRLIDPDTGATVVELPNPRPGNVLCGLEATHEGIWFGYEDLRVLDLRRPDTGELVDSIPVGRPVAGLTASDRFVAYADHRAGTINLVDLGLRREVASYDVAGNPTGIAWDGSRIWYCDHTTLQLRAIAVPGISGDA
ncbi:PQQ-like beta-propeller repeat protein [Saccharothrix obliqua]|uniref:PQQ-like beta-propeller repeat protein n=1 Tax=Saccharothrix obliqua TaxID=2861747 RepID=UPI001C5F9FB5|nr:PQQ-like beta-propeller repeat protein [Saccharothrix obliqua]MBW4722019.1 PQQ-like beta-propeller repeat protein [Saccharothrix obliqua]